MYMNTRQKRMGKRYLEQLRLYNNFKALGVISHKDYRDLMDNLNESMEKTIHISQAIN